MNTVKGIKLKLDFHVGRSIKIRISPQTPGESIQIYVGHNVRARIPNIEVTNKISPASCLREVCKFIADSAFIRYGVKHKKTRTAGIATISTLCKYCIRVVMLFPPFGHIIIFQFVWINLPNIIIPCKARTFQLLSPYKCVIFL